MCLTNTKVSYGRIAKIFHWLTAVLIFITLPLGLYMVWIAPGQLKFDLYQLHKSIGMTILLLVILRLGWRLSQPRPESPATLKKWEKYLSQTVHIFLYGLLFLMPLTGWLMTSASQFPNKYFGLFDIPDLVGRDDSLFKRMQNAHEILGFIILGLIALHVGGAFKHYFIDRDQTFQRMLPALGAKKMKLAAFVSVFTVVIVFALSAMIIYQSEIRDEKPAESYGVSTTDSDLQDPSQAVSQTDKDAQAQWSIIKEKSRIGFSVPVYGKPFSGEFRNYSGTIIFDSDNLDTSDVRFEVRIKSVESGSAERDGYIVEEPWLDASDHPFATFQSTSFKQGGNKDFVIEGDLTLRGETRSIEMPFEFQRQFSDNRVLAKASGTFKINRDDFNIGQGPWADGDTVGETVTFHVELTADKQSGPEGE